MVIGSFTLEALNFASERAKAGPYLHPLTQELCGKRIDFILKLSILVCPMGAAIVDLVSAAQFFQVALQYFFSDSRGLHNDSFGMILRFGLSVFLGVTFYLKNLTSLRYVSFMSIFLLSYLLVVMIIELPDYIRAPESQIIHDYNYLTFDNTPEGWFKVNAAFTTFTYAFQNQAGILPVKKELRRASPRRVSKIIFRAEMISMIFYGLIMYVGYFSMGRHAPDLIFSRPNIFPTDYLMKVGMMLYAVYIMICVPVQAFFTRISAIEICGLSPDNWRHQFCVSTICAIIFIVLSTFFSNVTQLLNLVSGLFATVLSITGPGLVFMAAYNKFAPDQRGLMYWGAVFSCTVISVLGILSTVLTVVTIFYPFSTRPLEPL
jgi:amino acid permease